MSTKAADVPSEIEQRGSEPVLELNDIQGNIVAGFNKDFETLLFLRIDDPTLFKPWLRQFAGLVATADEVLAFNRLFKRTRARRRYRGSVKASWINIAFSYAGLAKLTDDVEKFADPAFRDRAVAKSASPGDPTAYAEGNPKHWLVRDGDGGADLLIIVAADTVADLASEVAQVEESIYSQAVRCGASVVFKQEGRAQAGALAGHEHFGFKDAISQPGLRGRASGRADDLLTPSENPDHPNEGKPGQALVWPGEFIFGYRGESSDEPVLEGVAPPWAKHGSYLVFRRLRQDVFRFHSFLRNQALLVDLTPEALGAKVVGRWASGAPIVRTPRRDDALLGTDESLNNRFDFGDDPRADLCPFASHIRKANPRGDASGRIDVQTHRLLRRGIPFGPSSPSTPAAPYQDDTERGLLFMAYMTSITDQFEFVLENWVDRPDFSQPGAGADAVLGQMNGRRQRTFNVRNGGRDTRLTAIDDWVVPTGGGYFFSPSLSALKHDLTR